jgi:hypothetical protein
MTLLATEASSQANDQPLPSAAGLSTDDTVPTSLLTVN